MARNYSRCPSILGLISFNSFLNDLLLFIIETDIFDFADDTTLYKCGGDLDIISENLEMVADIAINWLSNNEMVANTRKISVYVLNQK